MMRIRLFLACLLLVALPLQGALAASMRLCMPEAGTTAASGGQAIPHTLRAGHDPAAAAHAAHADGVHGNRATAAGDDAASASASTTPADIQHRCDICAACAHAAALSSTPAPVAMPALSQSPAALPPARIDMRGLPVPDKPPRA